MPHVDLTTSTQSMAGLGPKRTFTMQSTDPKTLVMFIMAASAAQSSGALMPSGGDGQKFFLSGTSDSKVIENGAAFVGYVVKNGAAPSAVWVDADQDPAVGPAGTGAGPRWLKAADDGAANATTAAFFYRAPTAQTIKAVRFIPDGALTADDTNYATLTCAVEDGAGGAVGTAASKTTKITGGSGNWAAGVPVALALGAAVNLTEGQVLKIAISKSGTGVVVKSGTLQVDFA